STVDMCPSALDAATSRPVALAVALGRAGLGDAERRVAAADAVRAVEVVAASARCEAHSARREASRERERRREIADELSRATRARVRAETATRALRCELECQRAAGAGAGARLDVQGGMADGADDAANDEGNQMSSGAVSVEDEDELEDGSSPSSPSPSSPSSSSPSLAAPAITLAAFTIDDERVGGERASHNGRDRRVRVPEVNSAHWRHFAAAESELDASTTHRIATLISMELAKASVVEDGEDASKRIREFFYKHHGSRSLGEIHHKMFARGLHAQSNAGSAWAQTFSRLREMDQVEIDFALRSIRFTQFVIVESTASCEPVLGVDEAVRAFAFTLAPVIGDAQPPASELESLRRSSTHSDGISLIPLAQVIEHVVAVVTRARDAARKSFRDTFAERHPHGLLSHHSAIVSALAESLRKAGPFAQSLIGSAEELSATLDRAAVEIARGDASFVTRERFAEVAWREMERHRSHPITSAPLRPSKGKPTSNALPIETTTSFAVVTCAWSSVAVVLDRWLSERPVDGERPHSMSPHPTPSIPFAQSTDADKRRIVRRHVERVSKLRRTAEYAVRAASARLKSRRPDAHDDVTRAWRTYAACACAFDAAVVAHARALGA
ncbi:unnamed product, partial [Ostreococcus tauri]